MAGIRTYLSDFALANPVYAGATVSVFEVDPATLEVTTTLATLYDAISGSGTLTNPQTLDSEGKWVAPPYVDTAVVMQVSGASVPSHETGITGGSSSYRGTWATDTAYLFGDTVRDGADGANTRNIYICVTPHTSGTWATDLAATDWVLYIEANPANTYVLLAGDEMTGDLTLPNLEALEGITVGYAAASGGVALALKGATATERAITWHTAAVERYKLSHDVNNNLRLSGLNTAGASRVTLMDWRYVSGTRNLPHEVRLGTSATSSPYVDLNVAGEVSARTFSVRDLTQTWPTSTITGASRTNPVVLTIGAGHDFKDDDQIWVSGALGMTEINDTEYTAGDITETTISLYSGGSPVDGLAYTTYVSGGTVQLGSPRRIIFAKKNMTGSAHLDSLGNGLVHFGSNSDALNINSDAASLAYVYIPVKAQNGFNGNRTGLFVDMSMLGNAISLGSTGDGFVGISSHARTSVNVGGVSTNYGTPANDGIGVFWGALIKAQASANATYLKSITGAELNPNLLTGTSAVSHIGVLIAQEPGSTEQGVNNDKGIEFSHSEATGGWRHAISIQGTYNPVHKDNGYLFSARKGSYNHLKEAQSAGGIDFRQWSFAGASGAAGGGFAFRWNGGQLTPAGDYGGTIQLGYGAAIGNSAGMQITVNRSRVASVTINAGGTGWVANAIAEDTLGNVVKIDTVSAGAATAVTLVHRAWGTSTPATSTFTPVNFASSAGAGLVLNLTWDTATSLALNPTAGSVSVGTATPDRTFHAEASTSATNTVTQVARFTSVSTGTPANGIGAGIELEVETAAGNNEVGVVIEAVVTDVGSGTEDFDLVVRTMVAGASATEAYRANVAAFTVPTSYKVGADQVVGARNTGWSAMTGTPDESTIYDTGTVTLAQLAGRVAALQVALTTHGLIGT